MGASGARYLGNLVSLCALVLKVLSSGCRLQVLGSILLHANENERSQPAKPHSSFEYQPVSQATKIAGLT